MNWKRTGLIGSFSLILLFASAQRKTYPQGYFRNPMAIPMELVANFGELRANHWHMGLDIRTQQRENLPVYAPADGYVAKVSIEPGGFGQALYLNHPNGLTTLYAHMNGFYPALARYVKEEQYRLEAWEVDLPIPEGQFAVKKGELIGYSGNTGGSQGPHVHFEVRNTATDNCLNPLLFGFPVKDAVPPTLSRLALYDRGRSVYAQTPKLFPLRKSGSSYTLAAAPLLRVGTDRVSFALGATDRLSNSTNPNGIYSARIFMDDVLQSEFILDDIDYDETRYLNAQIDYRYKYHGGPYLQHLSKMPGDTSDTYTTTPTNGVLYLEDTARHQVQVEVRDADQNLSVIEFTLQYHPALPKAPLSPAAEQLLPGNVNVFEREHFEAFTSDLTVYDTVNVTYTPGTWQPAGAVTPLHTFCSPAIPAHDSLLIRLRPSTEILPADRDRVVIKSVAGTRTVVEKASWQNGWLGARFRQFGTYQAFVDKEPPTINAPGPGSVIDLSRASRIVFTPRDNFERIRNFRAEVDGRFLLFTNDKGRSFIYRFDEHFPPGEHELKVTVEDEAGNVTTKVWHCRR